MALKLLFPVTSEIMYEKVEAAWYQSNGKRTGLERMGTGFLSCHDKSSN